ncbi:MAG: hypothetical protein OXL34_07655 [Gemmatimonadota bacterium]|nr:hypothetical protein [Gemmatimonadota bacterium]
MNRETRTVRPFIVEGRLASVLEGVRFNLATASCEPGGRILVQDPDEYLRAEPVLTWAQDDPAFDEFRRALADEAARNRIEPFAASLVVTAHAPYLKLTDVVVSHPLSELRSLRRTLKLRGESRPTALWANTHGAVVTAYVALNREMPEAGNLRPWLMGTWLARAVFRLKTDLPPILFRPIPMEDDHRREHNLPGECVRYLHMGDHDPLQSREGQPHPEFYVDANLLARIDRARGTPVAKGFQVQLACDFIAGVVTDVATRADTEDHLEWEHVADSLWGRIVALAAKAGQDNQEPAVLLGWARRNPAQLLARVEGLLKARRFLMGALVDPE